MVSNYVCHSYQLVGLLQVTEELTKSGLTNRVLAVGGLFYERGGIKRRLESPELQQK